MSAASITIGSPLAALSFGPLSGEAWAPVASSGTDGLDPALTDPDRARRLDNGSPGIIGQWYAFVKALLVRALVGLTGDQHLAAGNGWFGAFEVSNVARHILGKDVLRVEHLRVDVEGQHAIAAEAVFGCAFRTGRLHARQGTAQ